MVCKFSTFHSDSELEAEAHTTEHMVKAERVSVAVCEGGDKISKITVNQMGMNNVLAVSGLRLPCHWCPVAYAPRWTIG